MGQPFIHDDFLLDTAAARELYHRYAAAQPIIDFHNHLSPQEIAEDKQWENLTQIWLCGDHYKWRAMRWNGIPEEKITGVVADASSDRSNNVAAGPSARSPAASDWERFEAWAATVPRLLRNPLYHWTHLELKRYFAIDDRLDPTTAQNIWARASEKLKTMSARSLMRDSRVVALCTTDDPTDSLEFHRACAAGKDFPIAVVPCWRPDKGMDFDHPPALNAWIARLEAAADVEIGESWTAYLSALRNRHEHFERHGCRLSDHGIEEFFVADYTEADVKSAFANVRRGIAIAPDESTKLKSAFLFEGARMDHGSGWTQQFHYGPLRNINSRMFARLGPDSGFDAMGNPANARALAAFLDRLDRTNQLAKTIIYNIHPADNEMVAAVLGSFQDGSTPGRMQLGSGWWFNDQLDGMQRQIEALSQIGLLSRFVGMLTDSRSFLSFTRHEYFRRLLCGILGNDIEGGLIPRDYDLVGGMVADICYRNARDFFSLPEKC
jgi:glucuronate isomerase